MKYEMNTLGWFAELLNKDCEITIESTDRTASGKAYADNVPEGLKKCGFLNARTHDGKRIGDSKNIIVRIDADAQTINKAFTDTQNGGADMARFTNIETDYTGGGIYVFTGKLDNGNYFLADTSFYDVRILDADPSIPVDMPADEALSTYGITSDEDAWASVDWQEEHLVEDLAPERAKAFMIELLKWIKAHGPNGACIDADYFIEDLKSLRGNWR